MSPARAKMLEALWARYQAAKAQGQALSVDSLCATYPNLKEELAAKIREHQGAAALTATADSPRQQPATQTLSFLAEDPQATIDAGTPVPDVPLPSRIARFEVRRCLGEGAFGRVYQAHDPQLDRDVALKVAKLERGDSGQRIKRFLREAKVAANLRHPHIIPLFEFGQDGSQFFIASAYIQGQTLKDDLDQRKKDCQGADYRRAALIVRRLAEALAHAHGLGIVHRDVKPANVMVDAQDQPLVMDFGLATRADEDEKLTHAGQVLGTPLYMSPEQAQGQEAAPACDQYSLGVMLYEMLTGQPPFKGAVEYVLTQHVQAEPVAPRQILKAIPKDLETICLKALAKDPARRYADCQALADDLRRWLDGEPIQAKKQGPIARLVRWVKREPKLAMAILLAAALLVAVAVVSLVNEEAQRELTTKANEAKDEAQKAQKKADQESATAQLRRKEALQESANLALLQANVFADQRDSDRALLWIVRALKKAQEAGDPDLVKTCRTMIAHWATEVPVLDAVFDNRGATLRSVTHLPHLHLLGWIRQSPKLTYHVQDTRTGKMLWSTTNLDPELRILDPILSPDGSRIAGHKDNFAALLDRDGKLVGAKMLHPDKAYVVGFHPQGQSLLTRCSDNQGRVWNAATGAPLGAPFPLRSFPVPVFSGDGHFILGWDAKLGLVRLDPLTGQPKADPIPLAQTPSLLVASPDGQFVAAVLPKSVVRFRIKDGVRMEPDLDELLSPVATVAFSPDNQTLALGFKDGSVRLTYPSITTKTLRTPMRLADAVHHVSFQADGKTLVVGTSLDLRQWRIEPFNIRFTVWRDEDGGSTLASWSGHNLYWWAKSGQIHWIKLQDPKAIQRIQPSLPIAVPLAVDPQEKFLLVHDKSRMATLCTIATGQCAKLVAHDGSVKFAGFNHQGTRAFTCGGKTLVLWDVLVGQPLLPPMEMPEPIRAAEISPDGKTMVLGIEAANPVTPTLIGRTFRLFDMETGGVLSAKVGLQAGMSTCMAFDAPGQWLYFGDSTGKVAQVEARTGKGKGEFTAHATSVAHLALSPDGARLATASRDATARLWNLATKEPIGAPMLHSAKVNCVLFHPDGNTLLTGADDNQVRFWDAHSGRKLKLPRNHNFPIQKLGYSQDGTRLLVYTGVGKANTLWQRADLEAVPINVPDEELPLWVSVRTGLELTNDGTIRILDRKTWLGAKQRMEKIIEKMPR